MNIKNCGVIIIFNGVYTPVKLIKRGVNKRGDGFSKRNIKVKERKECTYSCTLLPTRNYTRLSRLCRRFLLFK
ncbi:protein of unknown function [Clostridium beijerinckii]|nr:protein of unknown function [Clostridium beijerinckii]